MKTISLTIFGILSFYLTYIAIVPFLPKYKDIYYVFACPESDRSSRCYNVQADYSPEDCGYPGCSNPSINGIHINGGYIKFFDSIYDASDKSIEAFDGEKTWKIKLDRVLKLTVKNWGYDQQNNPE